MPRLATPTRWSAAVDATRHPDTMTADERRQEVARILARGLVRHIRLSRSLPTDAAKDSEKSGEPGLDLSSETRLSVPARPAG
ncbi:MAG: hypothetical protein JJU36_07395 [Phycisphaeraceae bacterium]|nr:hypothetical protein [Phycisphaeraceae bacterium]